MELNSDIARISRVIEDYGQGVFGKLDSNHVRKWLDQFDNHEVVAHETANILEKYYLREDQFVKFLRILMVYIRADIGFDFTIIQPQNKNKSQSFMMDLLKNKEKEFFEVFPAFDINNIKKNIIYIDDFIFSGQTLVSDFKGFLSTNSSVCDVTIHIITIGRYGYNANKTLLYLNNLYKNRNIEFTVKTVKYFILKDSLQLSERSLKDEMISQYISTNLNDNKIYPRRRESDLISNANHRVIYETEMARAGIKIINLCRNPNAVMKPLGYSYFGLGFGSTLFSYRNCPNTAPLAFWWGDPNPDNNNENHPLRKWYPLMQRIY